MNCEQLFPIMGYVSYSYVSYAIVQMKWWPEELQNYCPEAWSEHDKWASAKFNAMKSRCKLETGKEDLDPKFSHSN